MAAVPVEQSDPPLLIAKEHEFFAHDVDRHRRAFGGSSVESAIGCQ